MDLPLSRAMADAVEWAHCSKIKGHTQLFTNETADGRLTIGSRLGGADVDQVDGRLDGIRVYDTVLTGAEIRTAAVAAVPEPSAALLGGLGLLALLRRRRYAEAAVTPAIPFVSSRPLPDPLLRNGLEGAFS